MNTKYKKRKGKNKEEYEVGRISNNRILPDRANECAYDVKWKGYIEPTYEPIGSLQNAMDLIIDYEQSSLSLYQDLWKWN